MQPVIVGDPDDLLLCEGYLQKIRGFAQNRTRWFRATQKTLTFFISEGGNHIARINRESISRVREVDSTTFEIHTKVPFGNSGQAVMLLRANNAATKRRWLSVLTQPETFQLEHRLFRQGYMVKVVEFGVGFNRKRWFQLDQKSIAYYEVEGGVKMAECAVENIVTVTPVKELEFKLVAKEPFTVTKSSSIVCRCETTECRDQWLEALRAAVGGRVKFNTFSPLPQDLRPDDDRFGVFTRGEHIPEYTNSEGNRFIGSNDL